MISQKFLDRVDEIGFRRGYETDTLDQILDEMRSEWEWLKIYYRSDNVAFSINVLVNLSELAHEAVCRIVPGAQWSNLMERVKEIHVYKNKGYSGDNPDPWANFRHCSSFGIKPIDGCITRLCDKWARFWNVLQDDKLDLVGESVTDTLIDFGAYCLIAVCLLEE